MSCKAGWGMRGPECTYGAGLGRCSRRHSDDGANESGQRVGMGRPRAASDESDAWVKAENPRSGLDGCHCDALAED